MPDSKKKTGKTGAKSLNEPERKQAELRPDRCPWGTATDLYVRYHDEEWGMPATDDRTQMEFLILEGAQAGLSWETVLKKRENYRKAFHNFDWEKIAAMTDKDAERLLADPGIIRNRLKVAAAINNAKRFIEIRKEFGSFSKYIWGFVGGKPVINKWKSLSEIPARTELSDRISKDLQKRGFKFVGSVIIYSHLQATGIVNDHVTGCFRHAECAKVKLPPLE